MRAYNAEHGPDQACADTIDGDAATQSVLYQELTQYKLAEKLERGVDYFLLQVIGGIEYYAPNDEDWSSIIAVDHTNKLAVSTCFYEMDDMAYPDSDYARVLHEGMLKCKFQTEGV